jgi:uncharacterized membrane protein YraQ (UPF0718 family)
LTTTRGETESWFIASWDFAKQIMPLLLAGVLVAGLLLGRPGAEGLIPSAWISGLVGGNSLWANLFASVVGAFMYFATLTEVPILQGLIGAGMGKGPALALLLAGPALSLPNMLVIRSVLGTKKTVAFVSPGGGHGHDQRPDLRTFFLKGEEYGYQSIGTGVPEMPADGKDRQGCRCRQRY